MGVQKWPDGHRGGCNFFLKKNYTKLKKLKNQGQYGKFRIQLVKLQKFGTLGGGLQKFKLWCSKFVYVCVCVCIYIYIYIYI
jgi:hypothetical protein